MKTRNGWDQAPYKHRREYFAAKFGAVLVGVVPAAWLKDNKGDIARIAFDLAEAFIAESEARSNCRTCGQDAGGSFDEHGSKCLTCQLVDAAKRPEAPEQP